MSPRIRRRLHLGLRLAGLAGLLAFALFPIYWMVNTSFKGSAEVYLIDPTFWPHAPTLGGYSALFAGRQLPVGFGRLLFNSLVVAGCSTVISVAVAVLAAYAIARLRFPGRNAAAGAIFAAYMFPSVVMFLPVYLMLANWGLTDSYGGLILAYQLIGIPFATWMLRSYFMSVPASLEEAAQIDGCSRLRAIVAVTLPLSAPGIATAAVFCFTQTWNEFLYAQVILQRQSLHTAQVGLYDLLNGDILPWGQIMAGAMMVGLPVLLLTLLAQRFVSGGLTAGAVK
jgi:multiple sugar transport system permease protein